MKKTIDVVAPDGVRFAAYAAAPDSGGPGIVVLGGAAGLNAALVALCDRYADEGYAVIAPDLARHFKSGSVPAPDERAAALGDFYVAQSALREYVTGSKTGAVAVAGGGVIAWRAAVHGAVDACVIYGVEGLGGECQAAAEIACPFAFHIGHDEMNVDVSGMQARSENPIFRVYEYSRAATGFFDPAGLAFEPHSAAIAHSRSLGVLRPVLGPHYDLATLFQTHLKYEFVDHNPDATMGTMVSAPYVNHVPTLTGGVGHDELKRFYRYHFIPKLPRDRESILLSETVGPDTVVLELVNRFTHDEEVDYFLPGIPPTGKVVEIPTVVIAKFRGGKLYHEHIYWDQASVLVQLGLLAPEGLPVTGAAEARKMLDQREPANELMASWASSESKPI